MGRGVVLIFLGEEVILGAFNHVLENLTLWYVHGEGTPLSS